MLILLVRGSHVESPQSKEKNLHRPFIQVARPSGEDDWRPGGGEWTFSGQQLYSPEVSQGSEMGAGGVE